MCRFEAVQRNHPLGLRGLAPAPGPWLLASAPSKLEGSPSFYPRTPACSSNGFAQPGLRGRCRQHSQEADAGSRPAPPGVRAQIDINEVPDVLVLASKTATSFAEVGTPATSMPRRVSYGNNAILRRVVAVIASCRRAIWRVCGVHLRMDGFTIDGSGGTGLRCGARGTPDGLGAPGSHGPKCLLPTVCADNTHEPSPTHPSCNGSLQS